MKNKHTNKLIHSTSPYLLQHAHNPVDWQPWGDEAIKIAEKEGKLLLISIGYAACHWCHVMEKESFEDETVAKVMNEHFICVKVDREERPDVDHYYMTAVQLMQQRGGWPLNVIALPDGRPVWGGTYFPKENWVKNISAVNDFYINNKEQLEEYAQKLRIGIEQVSLLPEDQTHIPANIKLLVRGVGQWKRSFDKSDGGHQGAPKFPMPVNLEFLLYYAYIKKDRDILDHVDNTLSKMARGGIYDQIGGGFARYSVDTKWKVPHFEKMLYDNGQLLSIYAKAYQYFRYDEYKNLVYETTAFIERELMDPAGAFYSSLDADSEGVEGKFYVWKQEQLKEILEKDYNLFADYYNVNSKGFWEQGNYILLRDEDDEEFALKNQLTTEQLQVKVKKWKEALLKERSLRERPGLDDKTLTSWNALMVSGLVDAYKAFQDQYFLNLALKNASFLKNNVPGANGKVYHHWKAGKATIDGFLEDYSLLCQAFISLFEVTGDDQWLDLADNISAYTFLHFYDEKSGMFYFSEKEQNKVVANHFQKEDNVIPAANSVMANNLHRLYLLLGRTEYLSIIKKMVGHITPNFVKYPMAYANWGSLILKLEEPFYELVVSGKDAPQIYKEMQLEYRPNVLWAIAQKESEIPLLKSRYNQGKTLIYVCEKGICQLPVTSMEEARKLIQNEE